MLLSAFGLTEILKLSNSYMRTLVVKPRARRRRRRQTRRGGEAGDRGPGGDGGLRRRGETGAEGLVTEAGPDAVARPVTAPPAADYDAAARPAAGRPGDRASSATAGGPEDRANPATAPSGDHAHRPGKR